MSKNVISLNDKVDKGQELGTLSIVLLKAKNLHDSHTFRKQDAYAKATLNGIQKQTQVEIKAGQHPVWDHEVRFSVMKSTSANHRKLEVACYAKEHREDDLLGKATVDISETLRTGEFDDWVNLEVDGVQRGEIYLEMTYFANSPAPVHATPSVHAAPMNNKLLGNMLSSNSNLQRRPSKLSPADRLSRPGQPGPSSLGPGPSRHHESNIPQSHTPPKQQRPSPGGGGGLPGSLTPSYNGGSSNGSPPRGRNDPLPALPTDQGALPSLLRPGPAGGGRTPPSSSPIPVPKQQYQAHGRHPSASPPSRTNYLAPQYGGSPPRDSSPNPYIGGSSTPGPGYGSSTGGTAPNPYIGNGGSSAPTSASGLALGRTYTPAPVDPQAQNPYTYSAQPQPPPQQQHQQNGSPLVWRQDAGRATSPVVDPGFQGAGGFAFPVPITSPVRESFGGGYPPPVPPGGGGYGYSNARPPAGRDERDWDVDPSRLARYQTPLPLPPGAKPAPAPVPAPAPLPTVAPPEYAPPTPPKANTPLPDTARLNALKRAEDEARRRHEQEQRDLELAMQLDRELNMAEEQAARNNASTNSRPGAAMPGGWSR